MAHSITQFCLPLILWGLSLLAPVASMAAVPDGAYAFRGTAGRSGSFELYLTIEGPSVYGSYTPDSSAVSELGQLQGSIADDGKLELHEIATLRYFEKSNVERFRGSFTGTVTDEAVTGEIVVDSVTARVPVRLHRIYQFYSLNRAMLRGMKVHSFTLNQVVDWQRLEGTVQLASGKATHSLRGSIDSKRRVTLDERNAAGVSVATWDGQLDPRRGEVVGRRQETHGRVKRSAVFTARHSTASENGESAKFVRHRWYRDSRRGIAFQYFDGWEIASCSEHQVSWCDLMILAPDTQECATRYEHPAIEITLAGQLTTAAFHPIVQREEGAEGSVRSSRTKHSRISIAEQSCRANNADGSTALRDCLSAVVAANSPASPEPRRNAQSAAETKAYISFSPDVAAPTFERAYLESFLRSFRFVRHREGSPLTPNNYVATQRPREPSPIREWTMFRSPQLGLSLNIPANWEASVEYGNSDQDNAGTLAITLSPEAWRSCGPLPAQVPLQLLFEPVEPKALYDQHQLWISQKQRRNGTTLAGPGWQGWLGAYGSETDQRPDGNRYGGYASNRRGTLLVLSDPAVISPSDILRIFHSLAIFEPRESAGWLAPE